MAKTISSNKMREHLLARFEANRESLDWRTVLRSPAARDILAVLANGDLRSVTELAAKTNRAQPNVSRSLASLVKADLVEVMRDGRVSRPALTELGKEKAAALELVAAKNEPALEKESGGMLHVHVEKEPTEGDEIAGYVVFEGHMRSSVLLRLRSAEAPSAVALRWARDWWRMLYRRDALYRFLECRALEMPRVDGLVLIKSTGRRIEMSVRSKSEPDLQLDWNFHHISLEKFAGLVRECVLDSVADELRRTLRFDRPLHSLLGRLDDADEHVELASFYRTAGALDLDPYNLEDATASSIRTLIEQIPEEEPRLDFASAVLGPDLNGAAEWVSTELRKYSRQNRLEALPDIAVTCSCGPRGSKKPWQVGVQLAKTLRGKLGLSDTDSLGGVAGLSKLLGGPRRFAFSPQPPGALLAFQACDDGVPTVISGDAPPYAELFVLARSVGDYLYYRSPHASVADIYTDRQAQGRAFAAEFIAPAKAVVSMIEEEGLLENQVARHFDTTTMLVRNQYENNFSRV